MVFLYRNFDIKVCFSVLIVVLGGCSSDSGNDNGSAAANESCEFIGQLTGELNYTVNHDITDGCGGTATPDSELITSYGGISSEPNIKVYHENYQPGISANNRTAHVVIHRGLGDIREWQTALGACTINITYNEHDINIGKVKLSGNGSCDSPALPDTNTGATGNISIAPFTFESIWLNWP